MTFEYVDVPDGINTDLAVPAGGTGKRIAGVDLAFLAERVQTCAMLLGDDFTKRSISLQPKAAEWNFANSVDYSIRHYFKTERFADDFINCKANRVSEGDRMIWQTDAKPLFDFCHVARYWETEKVWNDDIAVSADDCDWCHGLASITVDSPFIAFERKREVDRSGGVVEDYGYYWQDSTTRGKWFGAERPTPMQYEHIIERYGRVRIDTSWLASNKAGAVSGGMCGGSKEFYFPVHDTQGGYYSINPFLPLNDVINESTVTYSTFGGLPSWVRSFDNDNWGTFEIDGRTITADSGYVSLAVVAEFQMGVEFPDRLMCGEVPE